MNIIRYPERSEWAKIVERPHLDMSQLNETVASVLADVKRRGDDAVKGYELKFDHVDLPDLAVSEAEMNEAEKLVSTELKAAIMQPSWWPIITSKPSMKPRSFVERR